MCQLKLFTRLVEANKATLVNVLSEDTCLCRCLVCNKDRVVRLGPIYRKSCVCQGLRTGPKARTSLEVAEVHGSRFNYKLIKELDNGKFRIRCTNCSLSRDVTHLYRPQKCACIQKKFYRSADRTVKHHRSELVACGLGTEYKVLSKVNDKVFRYLHLSCGRKFESNWEYLSHATVKHPCTHCRTEALKSVQIDLKEVRRRVALRGNTLKVLRVDACVSRRKASATVQFSGCGCTTEVLRSKIAGARGRLPQCPKHNPFKCVVWREFVVNGSTFKVRSNLEQQFIEKVLVPKGLDLTRVFAEPKDGVVDYIDPVTGKMRKYYPDFKVNRVYVEIKNLGSLGIKDYPWCGTREENLAVNKAKYEAAMSALPEYRVYVRLRNGKFVQTKDFWRPKEQKRLLALNQPI